MASMTFAELKAAFEGITGVTDDVSDDLAIWFNEAQMDLVNDFGKVVKDISGTYADVASGSEYALPDRFFNIVKCSCDYSLTPDGKIIFADGGEVTLYYRQIPTMFVASTPDTLCELDERVHQLIPMFAAARYWDMESEGDYEESGHGTKWMNYYLQGKARSKRAFETWNNNIDRWVVE